MLLMSSPHKAGQEEEPPWFPRPVRGGGQRGQVSAWTDVTAQLTKTLGLLSRVCRDPLHGPLHHEVACGCLPEAASLKVWLGRWQCGCSRPARLTGQRGPWRDRVGTEAPSRGRLRHTPAGRASVCPSSWPCSPVQTLGAASLSHVLQSSRPRCGNPGPTPKGSKLIGPGETVALACFLKSILGL